MACLHFLINTPFLSQNPIWDPTLHLVLMSPVVRDSFSVFPCLHHDCQSLQEDWPGSLQNPLQSGLSGVLLMIKLRLCMSLGVENHRGGVPSPSYPIEGCVVTHSRGVSSCTAWLRCCLPGFSTLKRPYLPSPT